MGLYGSSALTALVMLSFSSVASAQSAPFCVPGTTVCATSDGHGGVKLDASGQAQASPSGVNASGQANANANANADANAQAQADGQGQASGYGGGGGGGRYHPYRGRFASGVVFCPIARAGIWSGLKLGGCFAISFRWEGLTFELETQLLYGGTTHAFDWTFPLSFNIPLANDQSLFDGPYLRFGGSPIGATFANDQNGGNFVRFALFAGGGYELKFARHFTWRIFDLRLSLDMGTKRAMDDRNHWLDPGLQLGTGLVL